jgi:hypothetical protein
VYLEHVEEGLGKADGVHGDGNAVGQREHEACAPTNQHIRNCFKSRSSQCCGSVGTDPDPRISTTDLRIPIILSSSVADKMPTKNKLFSEVLLLLLFEGHLNQSSKIKSQKGVTKK